MASRRAACTLCARTHEFARVKGVRIQQLASGFLSYVDADLAQKWDLEDLFHWEMRERISPLIIRR